MLMRTLTLLTLAFFASSNVEAKQPNKAKCWPKYAGYHTPAMTLERTNDPNPEMPSRILTLTRGSQWEWDFSDHYWTYTILVDGKKVEIEPRFFGPRRETVAPVKAENIHFYYDSKGNIDYYRTDNFIRQDLVFNIPSAEWNAGLDLDSSAYTFEVRWSSGFGRNNNKVCVFDVTPTDIVHNKRMTREKTKALVLELREQKRLARNR